MEYWELQELIITLAVSFAVLIPITGLTLRFGLKPFLNDLAKMRTARRNQLDQFSVQNDDRLARIESQLDALERSVTHLSEVVQFDRQLMPGRGEGKRSDSEAI